MSNTIEAVHSLENALKNLLFNYDFLIKENEILLQNNHKLQHQLIENQQILEERQKEFDLLKIAKTIEGSSNNTKKTKLKINALIREIDKCIVQLHEY
ncbi:MAG: hypothetical protein GKR88_12215 [Flavobacteriaceae bacterium]|nr:MAG: hypothetical protein GKR88_12215 [Flavobacteriaceae bacterium]